MPEKNNAMIVNDIFKSYLSGMSINEIAEHLNTIYPKENSKWNPRTIHAILRNEKYIGDSLYQKTYTTDSLPLKRYSLQNPFRASPATRWTASNMSEC